MPAAANVPVSDLGAYQQAARLVLSHDVITATRPRPGTLELVLRWADQLSADLREILGYPPERIAALVDSGVLATRPPEVL